MAPKLVFCSAHHWDSPIQISAHQLARQFALHGWDVAFVSNPLSPVHALRMRDPMIGARFANWRAGGAWDSRLRVFHYCPLTLLPVLSFTARSSWVLKNWHHFGVPKVTKVLRRAGFEAPDLLVVDSPVHGHLLDDLHAKRTAFRITDFNTGFATSSRALAARERELARSVDILVITAERLRSYGERLGARRIVHVSNGVDFDRLAAPAPAPPEWGAIPAPRAVYVGTMGEWFDYALVEAAAARLPRVSFVLIGPDAMARRRLARRHNIHILGPRPHAMISRYLQHAEVGLIPFDAANHPDLVHAINPIKLYEYMACGLPVVATAWDELRRLGSPALLAESEDAFVAHVEHTIATGEGAGEAARHYARRQDWSVRYDEIVGLLNEQQSAVR